MALCLVHGLCGWWKFNFCVCVCVWGGGVTRLKIPSHLSVVCLSCINAQYFGIVSVNIKDFIVKLKGFGWLMLMSDVIAIQIKSILRLDISYYVMISYKCDASVYHHPSWIVILKRAFYFILYLIVHSFLFLLYNNTVAVFGIYKN